MEFGRCEDIGLDGWYIKYPSDYVGPFSSRATAAAVALVMPGSPLKIVNSKDTKDENRDAICH